jgi:hypothetical protein
LTHMANECENKILSSYTAVIEENEEEEAS